MLEKYQNFKKFSKTLTFHIILCRWKIENSNGFPNSKWPSKLPYNELFDTVV